MKSVLLFLCNGFEEYEASVFTDILGWSRVYGNVPVDLKTTALRGEVRCTWNFIVKPEIAFENVRVDQYDAIAIPGGFETAGYYEDAFDERFLELIREFDRRDKIIASVCVGALPIGKSGVLKNRRATTYDIDDLNGSRREQLAALGATIINQRVVTDRNIITSTGPSTGPDVAFTLLKMLTDEENVNVVRKFMRFE